jgi:hypothetical protein
LDCWAERVGAKDQASPITKATMGKATTQSPLRAGRGEVGRNEIIKGS